MNQTYRHIPVLTNSRPYEVIIGKGCLKEVGEGIRKIGVPINTKILIISNNAIAKHYSDIIIESLENSGFNTNLLIIEAGEKHKTIATISKIHDAAYKFNLERGSLMIALGGGVVGDITGFAASTWLRGISFIQIPTTLLAMVDSSVGGKTGVNHPKGKNLIGTFHQPKSVFIDPLTLKTLPEREFRAGIAEVIKYGVIQDYTLFETLEKATSLHNVDHLTDLQLESIIELSVSTKARIVALDEHEKGQRAILNYGHTFGHAIENLCGYGTWLHGEAVSIGMVAISEFSLKFGEWTQEDAKRQKILLEKARLPTKWPKMDTIDVIRVLKGDKKVRDGKIRFVIPTSIGEVIIKDNINDQEIIDFLNQIN